MIISTVHSLGIHSVVFCSRLRWTRIDRKGMGRRMSSSITVKVLVVISCAIFYEVIVTRAGMANDDTVEFFIFCFFSGSLLE